MTALLNYTCIVILKTIFHNIALFEAVPVLKSINQYRSIPNILCNLFYRWKRCKSARDADEPIHIEIFPVAATAVTPIVSVAAINKGNIFFFVKNETFCSLTGYIRM